METKMRMYLCVLFLSSGCGVQYDQCIDLDKPIAISSEIEGPPLVVSQIPKIVNYYITSLGGTTVNTNINPLIKVFNAEKYNNNCDNITGYVRNNQPQNIYLCQASYSRIDLLYYTVAHELGHIFGAEHSDCSSPTMMWSFDCVPQNLEYTTLDLASMCGSGVLTGGVCGRRTCKY